MGSIPVGAVCGGCAAFNWAVDAELLASFSETPEIQLLELVPVARLHLSPDASQVKVGTKGKHGVIAGRELTGNFQASAAPLYVWMRTNGELWLISGRHRYELMMRDNGVESHPCYVFREDAEHDEKWARMMDYENNMRDDQADELTAGLYVRETGLSDAELEVGAG